MDPDGQIPIRSYRLCFDLERRIHRVDRWRIPVPYGIPLRGLAYAAGLFVAVLIAGRLPLLGQLVGGVHPAVRFVVLPCAGAAALVRVRVDGRTAHAYLGALVRHASSPRRIAGFRPVPGPGQVRLGDVELAPGDCGARLRAGVVAGPCRLLLRYPARATRRGRTLRLRQVDGPPLWRGKAVDVPAGSRVVVES